MSLQVWLPLNGNLNNQGLGNITITSGNPTYKNGKVTSKSLNLNQRIYFTCPQLANLQTFSVCFWGMTEDSSTLTTNWQDLIGFTDVSSSGTNGTFRWETCYGYTGSDYIGIHWHDNATNALVNGSARHNTSRSEWCHCCVVFDLINQKLYSYTNGNLIATHTHLGGRFNTEGKFYLGETNNIEGRIQDVRFYDHALSPKEVKEISKGLVLHYRLSGIANENLLTNSATFSGYNISGTIDTDETYQGCYSVKTNRVWWGPYINLKDIITKNNLSVGDTVTYSIMAKTNFNGDCNFTLFRADSSGLCNFNKSFVANEWQKLSVTFSITNYALTSTTARLECNRPNTGSPNYYLNTGENNYMWFAQPKLERGSVATQWIPNHTDVLYLALGYNNNIEYDCSGYSNNGTKSGTITCDSDTPRYTTSYKFTAGSKIYTSSGFPAITNPQFTINFWFNPPSNFTYTSYVDVCGLHCTTTGYPDTLCRLEACGSPPGSDWCWFRGFQPTSSNLPVRNVVQDNWNMITLVSDGAKVYTYTNGVNTGTMNIIEWQPNGDFYLGDSAGSGMPGKYSDVRIYATALNEKDILELYQTSFQIDNNDNSYAYELIEQE